MELPDLGFETLQSARPYGMKQLSLSDPDGYTLCFQWAVNTEAP